MTQILIVDDSALARERAKEPLLDAGFEVVEAGSRKQALDQIDRSQPDVLLLNVHLTDGDADVLLDELDRRGTSVPTIVATARDDEQTSKRFLERGAVDFLAKDPLYGVRVANAVRTAVALAQPEAPDGLPEDEPARVLVVDDSPLIRRVVDRILSASQTPVELFEAADAEEGMRIVEDDRLDVLLIDHHLPGQSGAAFLEQLRTGGDETPALGLTGTREPELAERFLKAGAYGVWTKEHESPLRLRVSVERLARLHRMP